VRKAQYNFALIQKIFFSRYSILQSLVLFPEIRKAKVIEFQPVIRSKDRPNPYFVSIVKKLLTWINPTALQNEFERDEMVKSEWSYNASSISLIDEKKEYYASSGPCKFLTYLIGDKKIVDFFKGEMTFLVPRENLIADILTEKEQKGYISVPSWTSTHVLRQQIGIIRYCSLSFAYKIQHVLQYTYYILIATIFPLIYFMLRVPRGFNFKGRKLLDRYLVSMPVVWGIFSGKNCVHRGVKKQFDDSYLYGEQIVPGDILHVFGNWKFTDDEVESFKRSMRSCGYAYTCSSDFRLTTKMLLLILSAQIKSIMFFLSALASINKADREMVLMAKSLIKAVYYYMDKYLEMENTNYKVELVRDDYNPGHIIRSIVLRRCNRKSIGIQHTASPYDAPQLAYVNFDYYVVYGQFYVELFKESWKQLKLIKSGREVIDSVYYLANNREAQDVINNNYINMYGLSEYKVLILMSGSAVHIRQEMWCELYNGLVEITKLGLNFQLIFRFRELPDFNDCDCYNMILDLIEKEPKFIKEQQQFSTHELMSISDLVITPNSSFGINEALVFKKPVFTFDLTGAAELYFAKYGSDFVIKKDKNLVAVFRALENNFSEVNCNWMQLAKDLNYEPNGRNCELLAQSILELAN